MLLRAPEGGCVCFPEQPLFLRGSPVTAGATGLVMAELMLEGNPNPGTSSWPHAAFGQRSSGYSQLWLGCSDGREDRRSCSQFQGFLQEKSACCSRDSPIVSGQQMASHPRALQELQPSHRSSLIGEGLPPLPLEGGRGNPARRGWGGVRMHLRSLAWRRHLPPFPPSLLSHC